MELNQQQKDAVFETKSNILVSASPGAGKTRSLVARALYKIEHIPASQVLGLITYTNAAADEIASRITSKKAVFIGTIHLFCLKFILRPFCWIYKWNTPRIISREDKERFFSENPDIDLGYNNLDELSKIRKKIDGSLDKSVEWNHENNINSIASRYYEFQEQNGIIDFNEIIYRSFKIVNENAFVAQSLAAKFFEILIDEFQDTSLFQYEILKHINKSGNCSFFMVGDKRQKIFRFAGAMNIVKAYSALFVDHPEIENKSECKNKNLKISVIRTTKDNHNLKLTSIIDTLVNEVGCPLDGIAILSTRWNDAFNASKAIRSKYDVVGLGALPHSTKNLNDSTFALLKQLAKYCLNTKIATLRAVKRNLDIHLMENNLILTKEEYNVKINSLISRFLNINLANPLQEALLLCKKIFDETFQTSHPTFLDINDRIDDAEKQYWDLKKYFKSLSGINGITSNTIHQAKGLEFEVVILNQINEGRIPFQKWNRQDKKYAPLTTHDLEDGVNLFYVALSRAKSANFILHNYYPSIFLKKITPYT